MMLSARANERRPRLRAARALRGAVVLAVALLVLLAHSPVQAQEREPLAMRIEFEWTAFGAVGGAVVGGMIWLTDPANPHIILADSVASGAAWGAIFGAGWGLFILQRTAQFEGVPLAAHDPLSPANRITTDPVATRERARGAFAQRGADSDPGFRLPLVNLRF